MAFLYLVKGVNNQLKEGIEESEIGFNRIKDLVEGDDDLKFEFFMEIKDHKKVKKVSAVLTKMVLREITLKQMKDEIKNIISGA